MFSGGIKEISGMKWVNGQNPLSVKVICRQSLSSAIF